MLVVKLDIVVVVVRISGLLLYSSRHIIALFLHVYHMQTKVVVLVVIMPKKNQSHQQKHLFWAKTHPRESSSAFLVFCLFESKMSLAFFVDLAKDYNEKDKMASKQHAMSLLFFNYKNATERGHQPAKK
jgi:hypothetical protein